jgi:hypothetical protein
VMTGELTGFLIHTNRVQSKDKCFHLASHPVRAASASHDAIADKPPSSLLGIPEIFIFRTDGCKSRPEFRGPKPGIPRSHPSEGYVLARAGKPR